PAGKAVKEKAASGKLLIRRITPIDRGAAVEFTGCSGRVCIPAPTGPIAHAHADIGEKLHVAFLVLDDLLPERRVVHGHGAVDQRPGGAVMEIGRYVFQLALVDALLDDAGKVVEIGSANT